MSEREYQQKMLNSESKIVLCDWDRGKGKSYTSFQHAIKNGGCYLVVSLNNNLINMYSKSLIEEYKEEYGDIFRDVNITKNYIKIIFNRSGSIKGFKNVEIIFSDVEESHRKLFDYVIFDERIPALEEIRHLNKMKSLKQIFIMTTLNEDRNCKYFEFITDKDEPINMSNEEWIENEIKKLMNEFSKIPNSENTTKTRMIILEMIEKFKNMRV